VSAAEPGPLLVSEPGQRPALRHLPRLQRHVVECPLHFARFDVRTGKLLSGPISTDIPTYEVKVEDGTVCVKR
jgi:nitrite reductase/ring-hydroxylating ferredoxin subunit